MATERKEFDMPSQNTRRNHYAEVTDPVLASLEEADPNGWTPPWISRTNGGLPANATTSRSYNGINILNLWMSATFFEYESNEWATYKQWQGVEAQVMKGQKATPIVFARQVPIKDEATGEVIGTRPVFKWSAVFNASQVEGYEPEAIEMPDLVTAQSEADAFLVATDADIVYGGDSAYWNRSTDRVHLPDREMFTSTAGFYSTAFHELTHWSGHESRLNREFGKRFGDHAYAAEELVAQLGAQFLSAEFGFGLEAIEATADYLAHWEQMMRSDERAIFTAAAKASQAAEYLAMLAENAEVVA